MKQSSQSATNNSNTNSNGISLLKSDHRMVEDLFQQIEATRDADELAELVLALHTALSVHARIEEEIFYPRLRAASVEAGEMLDEAAVEHGSAKHLLVDLSTTSSDDRFFRARLKVLKEQIKHHVREEEEQLMPMAEAAEMDLEALGALIGERRETLMTALEQGTRLATGAGARASDRGSSAAAQH